MPKSFSYYEERVLKALADRLDEFYLVGGTALSLYYFHHRESFDLDFFSQEFDLLRTRRIIDFLSGN
jgi:predicted nucleotidyltransferase